jgi:hypothetical protein
VKQRLLNLFTLLSLLLCVAVVAMWVCGFGPVVYVGTNPQYRFATADQGNLEVCRWGSGCVRLPYWLLIVASGVGPAVRFDAARKRRHLPRRNWPLRSLVVSIVGLAGGWLGWISADKSARPLIATWQWFVGIAAVVSLYLMLRRSYLIGERELRRRQGRCPVCGYDLTGNVSGVCSECGTEAAGVG